MVPTDLQGMTSYECSVVNLVLGGTVTLQSCKLLKSPEHNHQEQQYHRVSDEPHTPRDTAKMKLPGLQHIYIEQNYWLVVANDETTLEHQYTNINIKVIMVACLYSCMLQ